MTPFEDLPFEIILSIVDQVEPEDLYAWTLINKQLYAKTNPVLWRQPELHTSLKLQQFTAILKASPHFTHYVRIIDLVDFWPNDVELLNLVKRVPLLNELFIQHGNNIQDNCVETLTHHCPHLTFLSLEKKYFRSERPIAALSRNCQQLRQLVLLDCYRLSCRVFAVLATLPLEELSITIGITGPDVDDDTHWAGMALDLTGLHRLTKLTLHNPPKRLIRCITTTATDRAGNPAWPHLVNFYFEGCDDLGDPSIIRFIQSHPLLESIVLVQGKFTDAALLAIAKFLPNVITNVALINNRNITHHGVRHLVKDCPLLEFVYLFGCGIREHHFPEVGDHCLDGSFLKLYLSHLDRDAINQIQLGPDSSQGDDSDNGEEDNSDSDEENGSDSDEDTDDNGFYDPYDDPDYDDDDYDDDD